MQRQYVEKPGKVLAEQYLVSAQPEAVGICHCTVTPYFPDGRTHVHTDLGPQEPHDTDMLVARPSTPSVIRELLTLAAFEEQYGNVPA